MPQAASPAPLPVLWPSNPRQPHLSVPGIGSLSHPCLCQANAVPCRDAALGHAPRLGPGVPQTRLEARDGARLRCASRRGTCLEQGCSSTWVAWAWPQSGLVSRAGPGGFCLPDGSRWHHVDVQQRLGLCGAGFLDKATMYWGAPTHTPSHRQPKTIRERAENTQPPHVAICYRCWLARSLLPLGDMIWSPGHRRTHHLGERA